MAPGLVTGLIAVLFLAVLGLLGYGAYAFSHGGVSEQQAKVSMAREVLWTGLAAILLLGIFLYAHR